MSFESRGHARAAAIAAPRELRVAVIGAGRWGKNLVRAFSSLREAKLVAVCDLDPGKLAGLPPALARFRNPSGVLSNPDVDALVVATPAETHAELTLQALKAGKDVLVEKPMALTLTDALSIRATAQKLGRRVMVGLVLRYHPAIVALERMVALGELGTIRRVMSWRSTMARGNSELGAWWSLAPHDVSIARALLGAPSDVVLNRSGATRLRAELSFTGDHKAEIEVDDGAAHKVRRLLVLGTRRAALFDDTEESHKLRLFEPNSRFVRRFAASECEGQLGALLSTPPLPSDEPLALEAMHFVDCILARTPFRTDLDEAVDVVAVLAAGARSLELGSSVVLGESVQRQAAWLGRSLRSSESA